MIEGRRKVVMGGDSQVRVSELTLNISILNGMLKGHRSKCISLLPAEINLLSGLLDEYEVELYKLKRDQSRGV